jgi:hypothetical protein
MEIIMITHMGFTDIRVGGEGTNSATVTLSFPPTNTLATCSISRTGMGEAPRGVFAGIQEVRVRNPQGFDDTTSFANREQPVSVARNGMTSVTMIVTTQNAWTRGALLIFHSDGTWSGGD